MDENTENQFQQYKKVRVIDYRVEGREEDETNEALDLGWTLLSVQRGEGSPIFVIGWNGGMMGNQPAPQTEREKKREKDRKNRKEGEF